MNVLTFAAPGGHDRLKLIKARGIDVIDCTRRRRTAVVARTKQLRYLPMSGFSHRTKPLAR